MKAYNACLSVNDQGVCSSGTAGTALAALTATDINDTLKAQPNTTIQAGRSAANLTCIIVTGATGSTLAGYNGCVGFDADGAVSAQTTTDANVTGTSTCGGATGVCVP